MAWWLIPIGLAGALLRIWLTEYKLVNALKWERHFTSRFLTFFFFVAMVLQFQNDVFNLIIVGSFPLMAMCVVVYDIPFIIKIARHRYILPGEEIPLRSSLSFWIIVERLTLHFPTTLLGLWWYGQGLKGTIFLNLKVTSLIVASFLALIPFIVWDERITKKRDWPEGLWLFLGGIAWAIGFYFHFFVWDLSSFW